MFTELITCYDLKSEIYAEAVKYELQNYVYFPFINQVKAENYSISNSEIYYGCPKLTNSKRLF